MRLTPLWKRVPRSARAVMLKSGPSGVTAQGEKRFAADFQLMAHLLEVIANRVFGEMVVSAGTGVCVVNTVLEAAASSALAKSSLGNQATSTFQHQEGGMAFV